MHQSQWSYQNHSSKPKVLSQSLIKAKDHIKASHQSQRSYQSLINNNDLNLSHSSSQRSYHSHSSKPKIKPESFIQAKDHITVTHKRSYQSLIKANNQIRVTQSQQYHKSKSYSVTKKSHSQVTGKSHRAESQKSHKQESQRAVIAMSQSESHKSVTLYLESSQSLQWPAMDQVSGVPGMPGGVPGFYLIFLAESRCVPGALWLGFPAKSSQITHFRFTWSPCGTGGGV